MLQVRGAFNDPRIDLGMVLTAVGLVVAGRTHAAAPAPGKSETP